MVEQHRSQEMRDYSYVVAKLSEAESWVQAYELEVSVGPKRGDDHGDCT